MEIEKYDMKTLLLAAIKSEVESGEVYEATSRRVKNAFLKERLVFLAGEEAKHRKILEGIYRMHFGDEEIALPEKSPVPLPELRIDTENDPISLILENSMEAEKAAEDFYRSLAERFEDQKTHDMMEILAEMEHTHFNMLNVEYENMKRFEDYDAVWPMMHAGP